MMAHLSYTYDSEDFFVRPYSDETNDRYAYWGKKLSQLGYLPTTIATAKGLKTVICCPDSASKVTNSGALADVGLSYGVAWNKNSSLNITNWHVKAGYIQDPSRQVWLADTLDTTVPVYGLTCNNIPGIIQFCKGFSLNGSCNLPVARRKALEQFVQKKNREPYRLLKNGIGTVNGTGKGVSGAIRKLFDTLSAHCGPQHWWPCQSGTRWEIISGAILTQNTAWTNVEKAIRNLLAADVMSPRKVLETSDAELQSLIRPAGFFKQKCAYLKAMAQFVIDHKKELERSGEVWALRKDLLAVKGVGRETADTILLYAFHKPIFVIDSYTRRVAQRHLGLDGSVHYDLLQKIFMDVLPCDVALYNEYHALIVALCKESCHKSGCGEICQQKLRTERNRRSGCNYMDHG